MQALMIDSISLSDRWIPCVGWCGGISSLSSISLLKVHDRPWPSSLLSCWRCHPKARIVSLTLFDIHRGGVRIRTPRLYGASLESLTLWPKRLQRAIRPTSGNRGRIPNARRLFGVANLLYRLTIKWAESSVATTVMSLALRYIHFSTWAFRHSTFRIDLFRICILLLLITMFTQG